MITNRTTIMVMVTTSLLSMTPFIFNQNAVAQGTKSLFCFNDPLTGTTPCYISKHACDLAAAESGVPGTCMHLLNSHP